MNHSTSHNYDFTPQCPVPSTDTGESISLAHGEGARATRNLISGHVLSRLGNQYNDNMPDAADIPVASNRIAFTTDTFVVSPLFFPGGDIGSMAVYGTVNDLAVSGAVPRWLSLSLVIEEGLSVDVLDRILDSIADAAQRCDVSIVTGDTKVVPRGAADGLFINTTGVGEFTGAKPPGPESIQPGDAIIVSGPIGKHGVAVLAAREELALTPPPTSDSAPVHDAVAALMYAVGGSVRAIRDATRGGISAVMHEWSASCDLTMRLTESSIPVTDDVRGSCELLGLDPLHIANEGTIVMAVAPGSLDEALSALSSVPESRHAAQIGTVTERRVAPVTIQGLLGSEQPVDEPFGVLLPRIC